MDKLRVEDGRIFLTSEQERITELESPTTFGEILELRERFEARNAELLQRPDADDLNDVKWADYDEHGNRDLPGDKLLDALRIDRDRHRAIKEIMGQLVDYLVDVELNGGPEDGAKPESS